MLKNCLVGPRPIRLCVEKIEILMKFNSAGPVVKNGGKILIGPFSPNLKPLE